MSALSACESWLHRHDDPTPVAPRRRFCPAHLSEEAEVLRVEGEMKGIQQVLDEFDAEAVRHPDEAKDFIEPAIRGFFDDELASLGLRCGSGYRAVPGRAKPEQLDVTLTLDVSSGSRWSAHVTARRHLEREPMAVHMEIAFRGTGSSDVYEKVKKDLGSLDRSVEQGVRFGRGLPWTACVLLGPAWTERVVNVMSIVHRNYHDRPAKQITLSGSKWWPYVDAIVMPGVMYKKHDLFASKAITGDSWPAYMAMPVSRASLLRPLAVARGFLMHRLRILKELEPASARSAWPTERSSALLGVPTNDANLYAAYLPCDIDRSVRRLWHAGSAPWDDTTHPVSLVLAPKPTCQRDHPFCARPVFGS